LLFAALGLLAVVVWLGLRTRRLLLEKNDLIARMHLVEQVVEQTPLPIIRLDPSLTIVAANRSALFAHQRTSLNGLNLLDLHPELADHPVVVALRVAKEEGRAAVSLAPESNRQEARTHGAPGILTLAGQTEILWFGTPPDDRLLSREGSDMLALAEESASRMKSEFIANINHEVRTPMNAIIGYTEMLANSQLGLREKRFVAIIHKSSMALVSIFNDIMELSKIDSGRLQIMVSTVRLNSIINEVEGLFKDLAEEKGIRLSCRIAGHLPQSFIFDGLRLKQILQNLVSNAVKFTREGSVTLLVDGGPSTVKQGCFDLKFTIEDTGIGIRAADQQKIFELFRQGEEVITKQYGGVGLGLTLCSRLTKMMGGSIDVHSVEGQGTRFTVLLTGIQIAHQAPADLKSDRLAAGFEREGKLLVVDDVDLIKDVFIDYFQDSPYKVFTANNGEEALSIAIVEHPDIIFMDLNLSGTDGRKVTEQLRQMAETVSIPVVVMTGEMLEEEDFRPLFDDFLQKPFRLDALKGIVARYARPSSRQELQPAVLASGDEDEHLLTSQVAAAWNMELDLLRQQAAFSGSLTDAASLGVAMQLRGEAERQPVLTKLGEELLLHAHEPNILGVDRVLAKLSRIAHRKES